MELLTCLAEEHYTPTRQFIRLTIGSLALERGWHLGVSGRVEFCPELYSEITHGMMLGDTISAANR